MEFHILTLFPGLFASPLKESLLGKAQEQGVVSVTIHDLRDYALDKHRMADDAPYGGGVGMVLKPDLIVRCLKRIEAPVDVIVEGAMLKELISVISKALVDNPDMVQVNKIEGERTTVIELRVAPEDLGKVIGRQGRTASAMRVILNAAAMKIRKRAVLEIIE